MTSFETAAAVLGGLLLVGALLSGLARRSMLSLTAVFVLVGFVLGEGALGVLHFKPSSGLVADLATIALIVILFRDGLEVDGEMLQRHWQLPLRKLAVAMPITGIIIAVLAKALTGLSWTESFLLGALLSPTDPVLSSGVVTDPRVPEVIRHSLNLESGLNDGLALPAVLAFAAALEPRTGSFDVGRFLVEDVGLGLAMGLAFGLARLAPDAGELGGRRRPRHPWLSARPLRPRAGVPDLWVTTLVPPANGFIAVFVAAIVVGIRRPDLRMQFEEARRRSSRSSSSTIFTVFGSLLTISGLFEDGWAAVGVVAGTFLLARPVAIWIALAGTPFTRRRRRSWRGSGPRASLR